MFLPAGHPAPAGRLKAVRPQRIEVISVNQRNRNRVTVGLALGLTVGVGTYLGAGSVAGPSSTALALDAGPQAESAAPFAHAGSQAQIVLPPDPAPSKLDTGLQAIAGHTPASLAAAAKAPNFLPEFVTSADGSEVMIELLGHDAAGARRAVAELAAHGLRDVVRDDRIAAGWMPIAKLSALESRADVQLARALPKLVANLGEVTNQGDFAMLSNLVRERYAVDGKGIKVGILSTSFNLANGMQTGIANGDLPGPGNPNGYTQPVNIVAEGVPGLFPAFNLDEGRAMAEIVHDVAPGAELLFAGVQGVSSVHLAAAMESLAQAGADIIVDDIGLGASTTPFFQDDTAARKVNELAGRGVRYFVAAGNHRAREMYETPWSSRDFFNSATFDTFDFDPAAATFRPVMTLRPRAGVTTYSGVIVVQWDEPWATYSAPGVGASNALRLLLLDPANRTIGSFPSTVGGNPAIGITFNNLSASAFPYLNLALLKPKDGRRNPGRIKMFVRITEGGVDPGIQMLPASTIFGHNNARGATVVSASSWFNTPAGAPIWNRDFSLLPQTDGSGLVGTTPIPLSPILSHLNGPSVLLRGGDGATIITGATVGQQPILFDDNGTRLTTPETRQNPTLVGADAVQTSFFGTTVSNLVTRPFFFGTSAAAPNAGAVAALLLQASNKTLNVGGVRNLMIQTATDMDNPYVNGLQPDPADPLFSRGYDPASGHGLIQALPAVESIIANMGIAKLNVNAQCQTGTGNRWRIDNPNGFGVRVKLSATGGIRLPSETAFGANLRENLLVPPGGLNFETPYQYSTSVSLTWSNTSGTPIFVNKTKIGSWTACQ
jgi:Subtilase family